MRRRLGAGGFGEVFEAWDREKDSVVAVKRLKRLDPKAVRGFKNEFRSLARLSHRNLAQLYELVSDGEAWSFTMELVDGADFLTAMRLGADEDADDAETADVRYDADRLRGALRQLVRGVRALHAAGKLHRDLKPHNVLVTGRGRVVILDFGMVSELGSADVDPTTFVGTPHYMAPEQAGNAPATPAADWFSVGVMLYEVLVGDYPVRGRSVMHLLLRKQTTEAPDDDAFPEATPPDLRALCQAMLALDPSDRPGAAGLLEMLGECERTAAPDVVVREPELDMPLVGRERELRALESVAASVVAERLPRMASIVGPSGIGKSALGWRFVADQRAAGSLVWCSNCWENESVPYKAMDGIVDAAVQHLASLPKEEVEELVSGHVAALARIFPAFDSLSFVRDFVVARPLADGPETRRAAFRSLRDLLRRVAERAPLVLLIDDAHWGDRDSVDALAEILGGRDAPAVLLVLTYREGEAEDGPFLSALHERLQIETRVLDLELLDATAASDLARACGASEERAEQIASASGGDPYIIQQLSDVRHAIGSTVTEAILRRVAALDEDDRAFISALTIAARPMEASLIHAVAAVKTDLTHVLARLTNQRLLRQRAGEQGTAVECYHDRIRQELRQQMPPVHRQSLHLRLAETLNERGVDDPDLLALHYREGGELSRSATFARTAADRAFSLLAYDRAASGLTDALRDGEWTADERREMQLQLGTVFSYLGRGNEAAGALAQAAESAPEIESFALRRRAAEQLLRVGQFVRGTEDLNALLADMGIEVPASDAALNAALVKRAAQVWWRGLEFEEREAPLDPLEAERQDTLWTAANMMGTLDVKRGAYFTLLNMLRSLEHGDLQRVGRTLAFQAVHSASRSATRERADDLLEEATALIERADEGDTLRSMVGFCRGLAAYMAADPRRSHLELEEVDRLLRDDPRFLWELKLVEIYDLYNHYHLGQFAELVARVEDGTSEALSRDDMMQWSGMLSWAHLVHLMHDEPDAALEDLGRAERAWQVPGFLLHDFWRLQAELRIALYVGRPADVLTNLSKQWKGLRRGMFLALDLPHAMVLDLRSRASLALAAESAGRVRLGHVRAATKDARKLASIGLFWASCTADLVHGQVAWLKGELDVARAAFSKAEAELSSSGFEMLLHAVRVRLAELSEEPEARASALQWFAKRGVVKPESFVSMIVPVGRSS